MLNIASTLTSLISTRLIMRLIYSVVCSMCLACHWIYPLARVANDTYTWSGCLRGEDRSSLSGDLDGSLVWIVGSIHSFGGFFHVVDGGVGRVVAP
jgi:hypothetical protein